VIILGHLGRDPEVRTFQDGGKLCNLRIATSETWKDRQSGERRERTEWHSVVLLADGLVRVAEKYLHKGAPVYIEGQLRTRKWQDQSGNDRYTTEVVVQGYGGKLVMLGSNRKGADDNQNPEYDNRGAGYDNLDDEIPF